MELFSVDRLEGEFAILEREDGSSFPLPLSQLPAGVRGGSMLRRTTDGGYALDDKAQEQRRAELFALQNDIFGEEA